ncbi:MAG: hypothetical protein F4164_13305 [Gemmatimonadales bacterium]|nr:hypothetical protein [Gemmatimonadales bacterium]MYG50310.1 hypothetical protein [Gemmatimonadales bacterium]MYK03166.1 hypothetical protein [Candidatus Palauibacter ramosifaciens]
MDTSRFRAILLLTLVFAAGAAIGVAVDRLDLLADATAADPPVETVSPETPDRDGGSRGGQTTIEQFADELGLTADQRSQIEGFLDHYRDGMRTLRGGYRTLMDSVRTRIESVLTEEQGEDYRELLRQRYGGGRERGGERGSSQGRDDAQRNN